MRGASRSPFLANILTIVPAPKDSLDVPHFISVSRGSIPLSMPFEVRREDLVPRREDEKPHRRPESGE